MTARQRLVPLGICAVFAVGVTYYTFQPALAKDREERLAKAERRKEIWNTRYQTEEERMAAGVPSPKDVAHQTEVNVANAGGATTIPKDTKRFADVRQGQYAQAAKGFSWQDVPPTVYSSQGAGSDGVKKDK